MSKKQLDEIDAMLDEELEKEEPSRFPETFSWDNEGDALRGEVVGIRHARTGIGESPVATIKDRQGKLWSLWLSPMNLAEKWSDNNVEVGDHIAAKYLRLSGRMKVFKLAVVHMDGTMVSAQYILEPLPIEYKQFLDFLG